MGASYWALDNQFCTVAHFSWFALYVFSLLFTSGISIMKRWISNQWWPHLPHCMLLTNTCVQDWLSRYVMAIAHIDGILEFYYAFTPTKLSHPSGNRIYKKCLYTYIYRVSHIEMVFSKLQKKIEGKSIFVKTWSYFQENLIPFWYLCLLLQK